MAVRSKRWSREEYERLAATGAFAPDARIQLIDGEIVEMTPQSSEHVFAARAAEEALWAAFPTGFDVRIQFPLALGTHSEPEPDVAVVRGHYRDYHTTHPTTAVLVVEVAESTLAFDRARKQAVYAAAAIPEYWIVNLVDRVLEVYRDPESPAGGTPAYRAVTRYRPGETVSPLAAPHATVRVGDLLP